MIVRTFIILCLAFPLLSDDTMQKNDYHQAVLSTRDMVSDPRAADLVSGAGLQILNVTWEDTGRYQDSSVGPNISDMTIQVAVDTPKGQEVHCMPVIRFPNFTDKTVDVDPDTFFLMVGNEKGHPLRRISLTEFLKHPTLYLREPGSWTGNSLRSRKFLGAAVVF